MLVGIGSGGAWAAASLCGNHKVLSDWLNLFAAVFAAASVGYLTPTSTFCYTTGRYLPDGALELVGKNFLWSLPCGYRVEHAPPKTEVELHLSALDKRVGDLRGHVDATARELRRASAEGLSLASSRMQRVEASIVRLNNRHLHRPHVFPMVGR